jgi:hypothetical protein
MELLLVTNSALSRKFTGAAVKEEAVAVVACRVCRRGTDAESATALISLIVETRAETAA